MFDGIRELIPCLGLVPYGLLSLWGLGSVLITRFGTQDYSVEEPGTQVEVSTSLEDSPSEGVSLTEEENQGEVIADGSLTSQSSSVDDDELPEINE